MRKLKLAIGLLAVSSFGPEAQAARWIVPGSAHASGSGGTNWRTDLTLVNPGTAAATATIWFLSAGADNGTLPTPATRTVPAGGQLVISDILDTLFGRSGGGALLVESTEAALGVASRTYNKLPDREYGMALPGVPTTQAIAPGETGHLVFLVKSSRYRTNVAFAGTSAQRGTVRVKLRDASGALIGEGTKELLPNGQTQIDRVFDALGAPATTVARAEVTSDVPVVAFATVIDERTGDPFAVLAQKASAASVDLVVPSTAHKDGANSAKYRSDLRIFNPSAEAATVTLALYPGGATTSSPVTRTLPLAAGALAGLDDVLAGTFGLFDAYGALRITSTKPVLALANTFNDAPEGTSGQELPGVPVSAFAVPGDLLRFAGLTGDGFRTNLFLVNLGDSTLNLSAAFKGSSGNVLSSRSYSVPPRAMIQENGVFPSGQSGFLELGPGTAPAAVSTEAAVAGTPSFYVLATVIHNVSNDPFQVTPYVQAAASSGSCVRPTLPAAGTVYAFRFSGPSGQGNSTTTFHTVSDTVSTSTTDSTADGKTTRSTTTKTISYLPGNLVGVVSVDTSAQTQIGTFRTVVTFSPVYVGGPGPEVCPAFTWTSPAVNTATTTTSAFGGGTVNSLSVPARGRVVSTDETITVPAGTFRTYRTFVERDDLSTTETWVDLGTALTVRQIDVTPSGTQTLEATTIR
ncbi:MAG: hypothetical protein IPP07_11705 [Holophagales bacterium]|nr:hypothetical protein [Holophagales bacterium]